MKSVRFEFKVAENFLFVAPFLSIFDVQVPPQHTVRVVHE